ncbi:MAG: recombinase family protein [Bacillota bacterium]
MATTAIYIRWSTEDQGNGTTLQVQQEACLSFCDKNGWCVSDDLIFVDDGYSGGNLHRPGLERLRELVQSGSVDTIVVYRMDRLSRDLADATGLVGKEWRGRAVVRSATEDVIPEQDEGWLNYSFRAAFADYERRVIRQRTYAGKVRRSQEGYKVAGGAPYGYRRTEKPGVFEQDEERAEVVRQIFTKCAVENFGLPALARWLNEMGYKPARAAKWTVGTVRPILVNPVYKGRVVFGRQKFLKTSSREAGPWRRLVTPRVDVEAAPGSLPPLVSEELWDLAQEALQKRRAWMEETSGRSLGSQRLLTGIIYCKCGGRLMPKTGGVRRPGQDSYRCRGNEQTERCGFEPGYISVDLLDQIVTQQVLDRVTSEGFPAELAAALTGQVREEMNLLTVRRKGLEEDLERLEGELRFLDSEYRQRRLTIEEVRRLRGQVEEEKEALLRRLAEVETSLADQYRELREQQAALAQVELARRWDELDMQQRRALVRTFVRRVVAHRRRGAQELSLHIDWAFETDLREQEIVARIPGRQKSSR